LEGLSLERTNLESAKFFKTIMPDGHSHTRQ
jgi:hypothetical protein